MHLEIKQDVNKTETVNPSVIDKLYDLSYEDQLNGIVSLLDSTSDVQGRIHTVAADEDKVRYLAGIDPEDAKRFLNLYISVDDGGYYIKFKDAATKAICVLQFGGANGGTHPLNQRKYGVKVSGADGEITYKQAASIIEVAYGFPNVTTLGSFDEFQFFTGLTYIGPNAFSGSSITSIIIPDTVTRLLAKCFMGCRQLQTVTLPESITLIGALAFRDCSNLVEINIPSTVQDIGETAFLGCASLTSIVLPEGITNIKNYTFYGCTSLTSCNIPSTVQDIGEFAFHNASLEGHLEIPYGVTIIRRNAFYNCRIESVTIPESVTAINGPSAFTCPGLKSVTLPSSLEVLGSSTFYGCASLTEIKVLATTPPTLGSTVFLGVPADTKIQVPAESVEAYKAASGWSTYASRIIAIQE